VNNQGERKAVVYCRVSTRNQKEEGSSLESQADACVKHAESLGYTIGRVTKEVYSGAELLG
jgi:site-specific DNA recombinase